MRHTIETAPRNGSVVIIEDDASRTYDVAHWSPEAGEWIREDGEPSKITPSHWYPLLVDNHLQQELDLSSSLSQAAPAASPARGDNLSAFSGADAPQLSSASEIVASRVAAAALMSIAAVEAQTASRVRRAFATSWIAVIFVTVTLVGIYFQAEVADSVARYASQHEISRLITMLRQVIAQETPLPSQDSRQTGVSAFQRQAEPDQAGAQAGTQETAQIKQSVEAPAPEAQQSLEKEQRTEVLTNEPVEARQGMLNPQLRAAVANSAQLLAQEREKTAVLEQDAAAARKELAASTAQLKQAEGATAELRQSLQQEHDRAEALASELASARRDVETQVALSSKRDDEAAQIKQAAESATAELRQSLQQEHDRAEALASELASARRAMEQKPAAVEEKPGVSLPAWANSDAFVKPRGRAMSPDNGYSCQHYRTYDPLSGTYKAYDGRRHPCP